MRSLEQIMNLAKADDFTKENAAAIVKEQVDEMVQVLHYQPDEARHIVLSNIGYYCGYYPADLADKVYEMFDTEHPIFGKTHPTPEEALRIWIEMGRRAKEQAQKEDAETWGIQ
jgi:hypothetical protein